MLDQPLLLALFALLSSLASGWLGHLAAVRRRQLAESEREDFRMVVGATLTLLGLIVGFSFSMALGRFDQRTANEEAEANAIETEYLRADLLGDAEAARVKDLLRSYVQARIEFYSAADPMRLPAQESTTRRLQSELWNEVRNTATANRDPVTALVASGMNNVLDAQGNAQAAWWNRIPAPAWALMLAMSLCSTFLVGYSARDARRERGILLVLPIVLAISFYLISDIESPRGGFIRIVPNNLLAAAASMQAEPAR